MEILLLGIYSAFVWLIFIKLKWLPWNTTSQVTVAIIPIVGLTALILTLNVVAPSSADVRVYKYTIPVVSQVRGRVLEVAVEEGNRLVRKGDVLFRIDPTTYQAQVDAIEAQLKFAELRLGQYTQLQRADSGRAFDVQQRESEVDQLKAQLDGAKWNLDKTTVRAPVDGYVTNLALRKGARVTAQSPVMAFIDTSETIFAVAIPQIYTRFVQVGQPIEVTFKTEPGIVYTGRVETILQAVASGQTQTSGLAVAPTDVETAPFIVRIKLDDEGAAKRLPAGTTGLAAIFTDHIAISHVIRRVVLRQTAILNYVNPF